MLNLLILEQLHVIVVGAHTVDDAVFGDLDDSVCNGLGQLMVMGGENDVVGECFHAIVQSGDAFQVQMVGGLVKQQYVCAAEHHFGQHAADLFATGQNADVFVYVVTGEQHTAQEGAQIAFTLSSEN